MAHTLFARCHRDDPLVVALEQELRARSEASAVGSLSLVDLGHGPAIGRLKAAIGVGWHARDWLRRVRDAAGSSVDEVVEVCLCGRHHLLALGRQGVPAVRWGPRSGMRRSWVDILAGKEGAVVRLEPDSVGADDAARIVRDLVEALDGMRGELVRETPEPAGKS